MAAEGFYLAGGTAVAAHLGHRRSVDLDWFTPDSLGDVAAWARRLADRGAMLTVDLVRPGTLHAQLFGVRVTCLEYRYPLLGEAVVWPEYACRLASLEDLGCMKLSAIAQRGAKKDFVDLYALLTQYRPLPDLLNAYRGKYNVTDLVHVLYGLANFDDADKERMPTMLWDVDWRTVKRTIRDWVSTLL
jgi:hypothetical protein